MKMRYRTVEIAVAASVVVISLASLFVAVYQGIVMQRSLSASVWPVMEFEHGNFDDETERQSIYLEFRNSGLGPAQVRSMRLMHQGEAITSLQLFFAKCCGPEEMSQAERVDHVGALFVDREMVLITDVVAERVFAPQQSVTFARLDRPDTPEALAIWDRFDRARFQLEVELCYCSVFEDCWLARFPQQSRIPVRQCDAAEWAADPDRTAE